MPRTLVLGIFTNFHEIPQNQDWRIGLAKNERDALDFLYAAPSNSRVCGFR